MPPRKREKNLDLPRRMRRSSSGMHYYDHGPGPDGKRHWEPLSRDLREAKLRWAQIEADRDGPPPQSNTVASLLDYYRRQHLDALAPRTRKDRRAILRRLAQVFGHMRPGAVSPADVAAYLEAHHSPVAANREIAVLAVAYRKAMRIGMVERNPCDGVERNPERARDRYVTDTEFLAVKTIANPWMQAVMDLAYLTAVRLGDLLTLERRQLQSDGIHLRQRKTRQRQVIERTADLDAVLRRLNAERPVAGMHVVATRRGRPYTTSGFGAMWRRVITRAHQDGIISERFTWHDIRAKSATDAEDQGLDPQRLLGHTTRRQTDTYLRSRQALRVTPVTPRSSRKTGGL